MNQYSDAPELYQSRLTVNDLTSQFEVTIINKMKTVPPQKKKASAPQPELETNKKTLQAGLMKTLKELYPR